VAVAARPRRPRRTRPLRPGRAGPPRAPRRPARARGAQPETLFVLDATTGQNGLQQARAFHQAVGLTGIVLTKLDSTAKGGIVFAIEHDLGVPVRFVGVGEGATDLLPFDPNAFVAALFA
jgi:fused signal recognition particle receptor